MKDILFYDGQCPLCRHEIQTLRSLSDSQIEFQDVHQFDVEQLTHIDKEGLLRRLHLKTSNGSWLIGLDATARAWSHTSYQYFFKPLRWPGIKVIADWMYEHWAKKRYNKRYSCVACGSVPMEKH